MMYTTYAVIVAAIALICAGIGVFFAISARTYAHKCFEYVDRVSKQPPQQAEVAELEMELTLQKDALAQISKGLRTIRNRMNVRETNEKRSLNKATGEPDPDVDPEGWKKYHNERLLLIPRTGE